MKIFFLVTSLPFLCFFLYAAYQSRRYTAIAAQPAGLAFFIFCAMIIKWIVQTALFFYDPTTLNHGIFMGLHILLTVLLLICVFGWRKEAGATYTGPAVLVALGVGVPLVAPVVLVSIMKAVVGPWEAETGQTYAMMIGAVMTTINFVGVYLLYRAIYGWRGYPRDLFVSAVPSAPSGEDASTEDAPPVAPAGSQSVPEPPGMFEERDFIPYVCGVMMLGGFIVVPIIWGMIMDLSFEKSLFPSLLSCGIFAFSHSKKGNFDFGRFIVLSIFVFLTIMRSAVKYGSGGGKPMFMAGGMLGFLVMAACGWAGIGVARLFRQLMEKA